MIPAPTLLRCFGCDCTTRDEAKVIIATDGRLRCRDCAAYEASLAAPAPAVRLGKIQVAVLRALISHGRYGSGRWVWGTHSETLRVLESLETRGLARIDRLVSGRVNAEITDEGRAAYAAR
jgi:hypothetical protein